MKYYLFLFCLFASSSSMAILSDDDDKNNDSKKRKYPSISSSSLSKDNSAKDKEKKTTKTTNKRSRTHNYSPTNLTSSNSLTSSLQQPSSSLSAPCCSTYTPELPFKGLRTLNSPLEFDAILETPEPSISKLKFNFTPTVDQLSHLTHQLPSLRHIDLSDTGVTNHEIRPLVALKNLEHLDLSSTNVRNVKAVFNSQGQENAT